MTAQEDIAALKVEVANLKDEMRGLREDVQQLLAIMNAAKGSWRTLAVLGGVALGLASLAAFALKLLRP